MKTLEEIAIEHGLCTCSDAYTSRNLQAPDCPLHAFALPEAMEAYAGQFRTHWIHISTPPTKEGTYLVIWKCGGKWVDQAITFPGEDKVRFMSFDIEWWAVFPEGPEGKEERV